MQPVSVKGDNSSTCSLPATLSINSLLYIYIYIYIYTYPMPSLPSDNYINIIIDGCFGNTYAISCIVAVSVLHVDYLRHIQPVM